MKSGEQITHETNPINFREFKNMRLLYRRLPLSFKTSLFPDTILNGRNDTTKYIRIYTFYINGC